MSRTYLNDEEVIEMYHDIRYTMVDMEEHFGCDVRTLYRHMAWYGITPNRKSDMPWTPHEEAQLIDACRNHATGSEYSDYVPTRTPAACKSHRRMLKEYV